MEVEGPGAAEANRIYPGATRPVAEGGAMLQGGA
jgi:hypothetical protein